MVFLKDGVSQVRSELPAATENGSQVAAGATKVNVNEGIENWKQTCSPWSREWMWSVTPSQPQEKKTWCLRANPYFKVVFGVSLWSFSGLRTNERLWINLFTELVGERLVSWSVSVRLRSDVLGHSSEEILLSDTDCCGSLPGLITPVIRAVTTSETGVFHRSGVTVPPGLCLPGWALDWHQCWRRVSRA